jgi:hypothetical protein
MELNNDLTFTEIDLMRTSLDEENYKKICADLNDINNLNHTVNELLGINQTVVNIEHIENVVNIEQNTEIMLKEIDDIQTSSYSYKPILLGSTIGLILAGPVGLLMGLKYGAVIVALSGGISGGLLGKYIK